MDTDCIKFIIESMNLIKHIKNSKLKQRIYDTHIISNFYSTTVSCADGVIITAENFSSNGVDYPQTKNIILSNHERLSVVNYHNFNNLWIIDNENTAMIDIDVGKITNYDEFNEQLFLTSTVYSDKISKFICLCRFIFELRIGHINLHLLESYNIDYKKELIHLYALQKELMVSPWIS